MVLRLLAILLCLYHSGYAQPARRPHVLIEAEPILQGIRNGKASDNLSAVEILAFDQSLYRVIIKHAPDPEDLFYRFLQEFDLKKIDTALVTRFPVTKTDIRDIFRDEATATLVVKTLSQRRYGDESMHLAREIYVRGNTACFRLQRNAAEIVYFAELCADDLVVYQLQFSLSCSPGPAGRAPRPETE